MRPLYRLRRGVFLWLLSLVLAWPSASPAQDLQGPGFAYYEVGDLDAPRPGPRVPAMMLMGGGEWVPEAFQWWLKQAGHGRVLILRASGKDELQDRLYHQIGGTTAVQTLVFDSRRGADDPAVLRAVAAADAIFIAGGDQSRYIRFWKGTALNRALNAHVRAGKPIAGTSAGLAILGLCLRRDGRRQHHLRRRPGRPDGPRGDPRQRLPADALPAARGHRHHFDKRDRLGRLIVFVARAALESGDPGIVGIGVDEDTALCVEPDGQAQVYSADGQGRVWVVSPGRSADRLVEGEPLRFHAVPVTVVASGSRMRLDDVQAEADYQAVADISDGEIEFTLR